MHGLKERNIALKSPITLQSRGFTIIELLVVVSIIALLIGMLLPAISKARDSAKVTQSLSNLRNLAAAHQSYAAEWNDRQFTLVRDDLAMYGSAESYPTHPSIELGLGMLGDTYQMIALHMSGDALAQFPANADFLFPIYPSQRTRGWFRLPNARAFNTYVNDRFYDPTFYAPKDHIVVDSIGQEFDSPWQYSSPDSGLNDLRFSSYSISPAGLFSPAILAAKDPVLSPSIDSLPAAAFRVPSMSQARHPSLKTHMLENHWLQGGRGSACIPGFLATPYDCQPYFFNLSVDSAPCSMFFDGSVRVMGVREAVASDEAVRQSGGRGLYFRPGDQGFEEADDLSISGYWLEFAADEGAGLEGAAVGYHILTKDGILGRDTLGGQ
jgi:prepilin-type N-terminal cleavage/methylation domain-containing protein